MSKVSKPKQILLDTIRQQLLVGQQQLSAGNRQQLSPEALRWVERGTPPSKNTDMDTLMFIRDTLRSGIPPVVENPEVINRLWDQAQQALSDAEKLWNQGDGGLLPRTACDAAYVLRTQTEDYTISQLQGLIVDLGGNL